MSTRRVAIVQSNYIPWKGYFDLIASVDTFVLYDDMQYTRRDWRNRNQIKTPQGLCWLTVPVRSKGRYEQRINETEIDGQEWVREHWRSLELNYRRAPHFAEVSARLRPFYEEGRFSMLSDLNRALLEWGCGELGIQSRIVPSSDYTLRDGKSERLADLCQQLGGEVYVSGPAARDYLDPAPFTERGIAVEWFNYQDYPDYPQLWGEFVAGVSILDLLFNCGPDAARYMKHVLP